jgi:hypothetical protein
MSSDDRHRREVIEKILAHLRAGDGLAEITSRTGIGGVNAKGRRHLRRWLERNGRADLWEWIRENTRPWSNTWTR